jgi:hypothetical protein
VAYLTKLLSSNENTFEKYKNPTLIKEIEITHSSYMKLNKLKKSSPEAYYYWVKALNINE